MRNLQIFGATLALSALATSMAFAQPFGGNPVYVTGEVTDPNWDPGNGAALSGGTAAAGDYELTDVGSNGVFELTLTVGEMGVTPGAAYVWKASTSGFGIEAPDSFNDAKFTVPASFTSTDSITFFVDTNTQDDGFVPDAGSGVTNVGFVYTNVDAAFAQSATSVQVTGSFQDELGGTDFDPAGANAVTLVDDGTGADSASGDGIYSGTLTGVSDGAYEFKVTFDEAFGGSSIGTAGMGGGGNLSFTVLDSSDVITFEYDSNESRVLADNPAVAPGPPFYAQSAAWSEGFNSTTELTPNTDSITGGTYHAGLFTIATADDYEVRVRQGEGRSFPDTGNYPFTTTSDGQEILVLFDTNDYTDGYEPATDFVVVLDADTRDPLNTWDKVQPVGDWQSEFGSTDFNAAAPAMDAADDGSTPDTAANDGIFSVTLTELADSGDFTADVKAVGQRTGAGDTGFDIQFGGPLDGLTITGNNSAASFTFTGGADHTFKIDTATGRVGVDLTGTKALADPDRGEYFDPNVPVATSVTDWTLY